MKKLVLIALILLFAVIVYDCKKKNYPSDIPKWLRVKIDKMNKETKKGLFGKPECKYSNCRTVTEYTDGSSTFYWISTGEPEIPQRYFVYNYNGDQICDTRSFLCTGVYDKSYVRRVWRENTYN